MNLKKITLMLIILFVSPLSLAHADNKVVYEPTTSKVKAVGGLVRDKSKLDSKKKTTADSTLKSLDKSASQKLQNKKLVGVKKEADSPTKQKIPKLKNPEPKDPKSAEHYRRVSERLRHKNR